MANEYLKRTPTSTGNRSVYTWAGWVKRNKINQDYYLFSSGDDASNIFYVSIRRDANNNNLTVLFRDGDTSSHTLVFNNNSFRDPSSWMHFVVAVDTTIVDSKSDRCKVYINGKRLTGWTTDQLANITQNGLTSTNALELHTIGEYSVSSSPGDFQIFDYFLVDGQALTPDVFGFYKDGDGYMSSGTSNATDFRPGQWMPHSPTKIKKDINRRGGFGVNGFYLPMNDSSNPGADFHCAPNSIIKLKGEDLPQPRNGAPVTSDAYVSQLRSDPYAANLVLAVPGISGGTSSGYGDYSADIKGSGSNKTLTAVGNAGVTVTASYYGSALSFDGSGDYFDISESNNEYDLDGDYTIECWVNFNSVNSVNDIIGTANNSVYLGSGKGGWVIGYASFSNIGFRFGYQNNSSWVFEYHTGIMAVANQWYHVAISHSGSTQQIIINGVVVRTATQTNTITSTENVVRVGGGFGSTSGLLNGQIQDFRVYKGVAKYKGGFDVPKPYTPVGIEAFRTTDDTCKNNFATLNPLIGAGIAAGDNVPVLKDGNLYYDNANQSWTTSTHGVSSGKYYAEFMVTGGSFSSNIGVCGDNRHGRNNQQYHAARGISYIRLSSTAVKKNYNDTSVTEGADAAFSYESGAIVGVTIDFDNKEIKYYKNGTLIRTDSTPASYTPVDSAFYFLAFRTNDGSSGASWADVVANFGQNPTFSGTITAGTNADDSGKGLFKYAPPTGFLALCEDNLPTPAIADPGKHFKTVLYTGKGTNGTDGSQSIRKVGFQPDLVWVKKRGTAGDNKLIDVVRGAGQVLESNTTDIEGDERNNFTGFNSDGFDLGANNAGAWNENNYGYVAWCWKAGGAAVSNTDGTLASQVSVNQDAGFSIVKFTAQTSGTGTVGHGLGKKPAFWIYKPHTNTTNWYMYHQNLGASAWLNFTTTAATTGNTAAWGGVEPTSTVLTHGAGLANQGSCVLYAWTEIKGFSKFGSYVGNGNADGPFGYCGFKPAWVLIKKTNGSGNENWRLFDSSRCPTNQNNKHLLPSNSGQESTESGMDFISNGFKLRHADAHQNQSSSTYIFAAFAESPFQTANAK